MAPIATSPLSSPAILPPQKVTKPIKPLLRRATLSGTVRKRDDTDLYSDDLTMSVPSSPTKRARTVTFNPTVEEQIYTSTPDALQLEREAESVKIETRRAIQQHIAKVSSDAYDDIKSLFSKQRSRGDREAKDGERSETEDMRLHIFALTNCVSLLGKECNGLVRAVLECEWAGRDEAFVKAYVQFLGNLASAQGTYVTNVLYMLVDKFAGMPPSSGRLPDCPFVTREQRSSRVHMALKYLLRLIPSASSTLAPLLSSKFPWADDSKKAHMAYVSNMVKLIEYAPELKSEIFALMTERLVKIDVQMQVDLDDLEDDVAAAIVHAIALQPGPIEVEEEEDDEDDDDSDADSVTSDDADDSNRVKEVQGSVEKMDAMLDTLFAIYTPYFADPDSAVAKSTFETLLSHFRNIILPTYRSRHTQFLLFHFAQKSDALVDAFAGECVELAFTPGRPAVLKQAAAAYLASFVSRGAHVLPHTVREVFEFIGAQLDKIRLENEAGCRGPDLHRYGTFYATTQALLYVFCFRWRDLIISHDEEQLDEEDDYMNRDLEWNAGVKELLMRTIYSKLNPLKICAPSIVEEFARIAHHLRFMYVYPLLEANKRVRLSHFALGVPALRDSGVGNASAEDQETWNQLDAYFPFDPYQLPVSRRWIEDDYVQWRGIPGMARDDEDDDSTEGEEDEDDLDEDEEEEDTATDTETEP